MAVSGRMGLIAFDARVLNERGTSAALYDFADGAERELGHRSVIFHQVGTQAFNPGAVRLIAQRFEPVGYTDDDDLGRKVRAMGADLVYAFNFGPKDDRLVAGVKNVRHVLFQHYRPYGDVYAYISEWLAAHAALGHQPWAPLIVNLPAPERRLRRTWGFSEEAVVLGRHGGFDQFDLPFVKGAIEAALERRRDLCFAFLNTEPFIRSERVRFLAPVYDLKSKSDFVTSCDAMLHARKAGEGFGLAVAEFLFFDKPVICWAGGKDRNHLELVPDRRHVYRSATDLLRILLGFRPAPSDGRYRAAVARFAPPQAMARFADVFIEGRVEAKAPPPWPMRARAKLTTRALVLQGRLWRDRGDLEVRAWRKAPRLPAPPAS
ncbi:MAG TPA: hypothetical protein VMU93_05005 [Caulobacteraceae bacterium]|nr:hypothetical protein [Caulobacteraceae bacterium]